MIDRHLFLFSWAAWGMVSFTALMVSALNDKSAVTVGDLLTGLVAILMGPLLIILVLFDAMFYGAVSAWRNREIIWRTEIWRKK